VARGAPKRGGGKGKPAHPLVILGLVVILLLAVWLMFGPPMSVETMLWLNAVMLGCAVATILVARASRR